MASLNLDDDLLVLLYDVGRLIRRRADQMARQHGTTRAQWVVVARLARQPGMCQAELASVAEVEPITMARLIDRLEARGLVERRPDDKDRRLRRLHLTEKAKPLVDEVDSFRAEMRAILAEGLDRGELVQLHDSLRCMKANLCDEKAARAQDRHLQEIA